jgi:hypothetical protein
MPEFRQALYDAGLISKLDEDLADYANGRDGALSFDDNEAVDGNFEELEEWLILNGIDFNRQSDGYCEYSPCLVMFRKGIGQLDFILDHDGHHVMRVDDVLRLIDQNPDMGSLVLRIREENGQEIPSLRPFFGTVPQVFAADELKRRNTDPTVTVCAACGADLSDPGLGPAYKHCPKCEP